MGETGEIVGMVDVLKLTYATLEQINSMNTGDQEGPAWNKFWLSMDNDTESVMSGEGSHRPTTPGHRSVMDSEVRPGIERGDSVMPHESASHVGDEAQSDVASPAEPPENLPFPFKFKAPSGRVHRLQVIASEGIAELVTRVSSKLGSEVEAVGGEATVEDGKMGKAGYALSYLDNEGDTVSITTDQDLVEAITITQKAGRDKVDLFVHDPAQPPHAVTLEPRPQLPAYVPTPPESSVAKEKREDDEEEEEIITKRKPKKQATAQKDDQQIISGVPNDLLLPGAIAGLAVVIIAVFALSRSSKP
jgi:hypothetical protein